jgi:hypothetical protein
MILPTFQDLIADSKNEETLKANALMVLLNQPPDKSWLVPHPMINNYLYLPIEKVEYLLSKIFVRWWVDIKEVTTLANSVVVIVRLYAINPITGETEFNDGVGAAPIQTDKGQGACDWNYVKADGVQKAAPAAESYAIKDAAEKWGKIFGKDINRKHQSDYSDLLDSANDGRIVLTEDYKDFAAMKQAVKEGKRKISDLEHKFKISDDIKKLLNA